MKNSTYGPDVFIYINVESTTNIQAWTPVLVEMLEKDTSLIRVVSPVELNNDHTDLLYGTVDPSQYGIQIDTTVREFKEYLDFFAERTRQGDIISVWESICELEKLIDEIAGTNAETNDTAQQAEEEIEEPTIKEGRFNEIKSFSPEELAAEIISFAKEEFPDQGDERRVPVHRIIDLFWGSKKIAKWGFPADIGLKIEKAEILARNQLESKREVKEKEKLLSLVNPCVDWAKEHGLKKVTEADVDAFLLERNIDVLPRTKKRALYALVNSKIKSK